MIKPKFGNILIRPFPTEEVTEGGIIIPELSQERPSKGTVIEVGEGMPDRPMQFKKGDVVLHIKNCGIQVKDGDEDLYILRDVECLATIEP